uniref:Uncharacterized protein n=1 Tax=Oryza sativa subsp. japonica TaxID=39947 RepID=Q69KE3_ORYSJ|nr:hypothetical protein [Oryza sativa Japonica Group]BAD36597.1 hypothetical protein [Oryza sativa Japonica Group]
MPKSTGQIYPQLFTKAGLAASGIEVVDAAAPADAADGEHGLVHDARTGGAEDVGRRLQQHLHLQLAVAVDSNQREGGETPSAATIGGPAATSSLVWCFMQELVDSGASWRETWTSRAESAGERGGSDCDGQVHDLPCLPPPPSHDRSLAL